MSCAANDTRIACAIAVALATLPLSPGRVSAADTTEAWAAGELWPWAKTWRSPTRWSW